MMTKQQLDSIHIELEQLEKEMQSDRKKHDYSSKYAVSYKLLTLLLQAFNAQPVATKKTSAIPNKVPPIPEYKVKQQKQQPATKRDSKGRFIKRK